MLDRKRTRFRINLGISIGSTVPLWGQHGYGVYRGRRRLLYAFASLPSEHSYGGLGFKAGFVFVRLTYGRRPR